MMLNAFVQHDELIKFIFLFKTSKTGKYLIIPGVRISVYGNSDLVSTVYYIDL